MIIKKNKGKKKKNYADNLSTPRKTVRLCEKRWRAKCNIDVCASPLNKKCRRFISKKQDFLKQTNFKRTDVLWFNFPHSKNYKFVRHLCKVWKACGCRALGILPINTLTSTYAKKYILPYVKFDRRIIITGRITFLNKAQKKSQFGSVNGYVTIYYGRRKKKYARP